jgi:hypothetical protein
VENEVLQRVWEERKIPYEIKRRKAKRIDHTLRRNCLVKHIIEGKIEIRI